LASPDLKKNPELMKVDYWQKFEEEHYYHIYNHAAGDKNLFLADEDYVEFLSKHFKYFSCAFETLAYCLMPNHYHFIVQVKPFETVLKNAKKELTNTSTTFQKGKIPVDSFILDQFRRFMSSYALSFNNRNNQRGQLFLKKFKRVALESEEKLSYMICYVHHNPIHHGFVSDFKFWNYSSFNKLNSVNQEGVNLNTVKDVFGDLRNFNNIHENFRIEQKEKENIDYKP
jgi:REP element-mobilizing transposase RayT